MFSTVRASLKWGSSGAPVGLQWGFVRKSYNQIRLITTSFLRSNPKRPPQGSGQTMREEKTGTEEAQEAKVEEAEEAEEVEEKMCRLCWGHEDDGPLVQSCACRGSPPSGSTNTASINGGARAGGGTRPIAAASAWTITATR